MAAPGPPGDVKQAEPAPAPDPGCRVPAPPGTAAGERRGRAAWFALLRRPRVWVACGFLLGLSATGLALAVRPLWAGYHFRAAQSDLACYHNPQAIRHLQVCLRVWPADADVLLMTARAARRARSYDEAERSLEKYQQARGLDEASSFEQLLLSAERSVDQVAGVCRHHVEQGHPDAPLILEALTRGYFRQYRLPEARFCLDRWLELQPENVQAVCLEGQLHLDYEQSRSTALESYRRAVQLDPDHEEARQGLAIVLLESKNFTEAVKHLEFLRQRQPDNLRVRVGLAECHDALGQGAEALRLVDSVLAEQPQFQRALALRGRLLTNKGDYTGAEPYLRQAVALNPSDHQARYNLILCLHSSGKEDEVDRNKRELKQMEEDLLRFNEIVTRDMIQRPYDPALHCTLGQLLLRGGHREEGLRWLHSALRLDPQYAPARQALAEYNQQAENKPPLDDKVTR
jgi:tetratricopeptide (TPR) repeat protein